MLPADRFRNWLDKTVSGWADRMATWTVEALAKGATKTLEGMEPGAIEAYKAALTKLRADPLTPPEIKAFCEQALKPGNPISVVGGMLLMVLQMIGVVLGGSEPLGNLVRYSQDLALKSYRLSPAEVITAWRRDPAANEKYFQDLKEQGWTDDRLLVLRLITQTFPGVGDIIRFAVREAYTPEIAEKFGQYEDIPTKAADDLLRVGYPWEEFRKQWAAHWDLPSTTQGFEMLRRGIIDEDTLKLLLRALDVMPYWRDRLINISWEIPTRVDVRRFWDMRTIDEARLREVYTALGYHGRDLDDYVLWTKIYVDFPDLMTRYKNGWLTLDDVRAELVKLGMSAERAEELIQTKVKAVASERTAKEKDLTMSQIVKGVKKAVLTRSEGAALLEQMGYDPYEATFILAIEIPQDEVVTEVKVRELTKTDILNGLKAGVITEDEALARLLQLRYLPDDARFILSIYKATVEPPTETRQKEASKADIVKAVKTGLITPEDGYLMLQDIGFSPEASGFILMVQAESSPFSPMSYNEYQDLVSKFRQVRGPGGEAMPEELKKLADQVVKLTGDVDRIRSTLRAKEATILDEEALPAEEREELNKLRATLYRAEAELQRVKNTYQDQLAVWRHQST